MIQIIEHTQQEGPYAIGATPVAAGLPTRVCRIWAGDPVPDSLTGALALVVTGGPMTVYDDRSACPHRASELALLRAALDAEVPALGVGLGAQLLAVAAGGAARPGSGARTGWDEVRMTPAARADPLFRGLPERLRVLHRQGDDMDLPAGATLLATGGRSPAQAFRIGGSAWGLQFHLEADGARVYEAPVDACAAALPEHAAMALGEAATVPDLVESVPGQVASATDLVEAAPAEPPVLDAYRAGVFGRFAALVADRAARTANNTFFTPRAATWEERFAADGPRYTAAVARMGLRPGQRALDVGCGTGRALPGLRAEVGARGVVLGVDLTPAMLTATAKEGRTGIARLLLADACRLPLCDGAVDGIFSAGLVDHLPDPAAGLGEWARVTAPDGVLLLFHPSGRAERAARHGRPLDPADPLAEENLRLALHAAGWSLTCYEDAPRHFLARAVRGGEQTG